jgi:hypothetical protein
MTIEMRVQGLECDPYDPGKFRVQLAGIEPGVVTNLFLRVTAAELGPYGLGTSTP